MKKTTIALIVAAALVALAVPALAFANGMQQVWSHTTEAPAVVHHAPAPATHSPLASIADAARSTVQGSTVCPGYADTNNDSVCDNCDNAQGSCPGYVDGNGDGVCDNGGYAQGSCPGYADNNGDGVCDNYGSGCYRNGHGHGNGHGGGHHGCMR